MKYEKEVKAWINLWQEICLTSDKAAQTEHE